MQNPRMQGIADQKGTTEPYSIAIETISKTKKQQLRINVIPRNPVRQNSSIRKQVKIFNNRGHHPITGTFFD